jgi:anthranilate synthase/aminodeoxychorismate synthase-like glutamine amidotransferase
MILIIDNYDSFTYNIAQALGSLGREIRVMRNDFIEPQEVEDLNPEAVIISPGPGYPKDAGVSMAVIEKLTGKIPILGVCLGHQCIGQVFGAQITRAKRPVHGKQWEIFHDGKLMFEGLRNPLSAVRYHSLIVVENTLAKELMVSAFTHEGEIMGLRNQELMLEGVQFHPESIATAQGMMMFENFLSTYVDNGK